MFLPVGSKPNSSDYPEGASIREQDWHILAGFWHPVAFEHDLGDEPQSVKLLDVDLVLYKTSDGITVARDRCPHRGVKVSLGRVIDDCLPTQLLLREKSGEISVDQRRRLYRLPI